MRPAEETLLPQTKSIYTIIMTRVHTGRPPKVPDVFANLEKFQPLTQAPVSVFTQVRNGDSSLANTTESLAPKILVNYTATMIFRHIDW